ncbi:MAG: hypothetical protein ACTSRP_13750 [Candidatus Helarchaeota archaeon]
MTAIVFEKEEILVGLIKVKNLIILIDGPNSNDVDLELLYEYAFRVGNNPEFFYFFSSSTQIEKVSEAYRLGFNLIYTGSEDVDEEIKNFLRTIGLLNCDYSILLVSGDGGYYGQLKKLKEEKGVEVKIGIGYKLSKLNRVYIGEFEVEVFTREQERMEQDIRNFYKKCLLKRGLKPVMMKGYVSVRGVSECEKEEIIRELESILKVEVKYDYYRNSKQLKIYYRKR